MTTCKQEEAKNEKEAVDRRKRNLKSMTKQVKIKAEDMDDEVN